jgi:MtaA/CmuA family methyltransferase
MSRTLLLDALAGKSTQRNVWGTGTSIVCRELMDRVGACFPEAHLDAEKMFALAAAGHTVLGFDIVMPLFSVCHEAAALGCKVNWGSVDMMPESGPPIFANVDDIKIPADFLQHSGCTVALKAISLLKKRLGDDAAICGKVFGSWTQAYHCFGVENFLMMTVDDPGKTKQILEKLMPVTVAFAKAQIEAGADCLLLADHATSDLCSPKAYEEFLEPMHKRLAQEIEVPLILHICGNTADRIKIITRTGLDCFHWDTKTGSAAEVRDLAGEQLSLMGGISNYMLLRGTVEEISAEVVRADEGGINIIGPECAIPLATPMENLQAIVQ